MRRLEIVFDNLPPSELYPNRLRSIHWSVRSKVEAQALNDAFYLTKDAMKKWEIPTKVKVYFEFTVKDKRRRDIDGMVSACKPYLDGLVKAGAIPDDDCWHLELGGTIVVKGNKEQTKLIIVAKPDNI